MYLDLLRQGVNWAAAQKALVNDEIGYEQVVRGFLSASCIQDPEDPLHSPEPQKNTLITVGWRFTQLATRSLKLNEKQKQFSSFQFLIWLSYLAFLETKGYSTENIDKLLQLFSNHEERRRRRFIPRAKIVNTLIQTIARTCNIGLARATEVFFLRKPRFACTWYNY